MVHYTLLLFHVTVILAFTKGQFTTRPANTTINPSALLFPYGFSNGDRAFSRYSYYVTALSSTTGFPFLTNKEYQLRASRNGYVYVSGGPQVDIYRRSLSIHNSGSIYYRASNSTTDLVLTNQVLRQNRVTSFNARMVFIITYYNVPQSSSSSLDNTFQFIYATDLRNSYGIFNYKKLESSYGVARFTEGRCNEGELPFSGTSRSTRLASTSNGLVHGRYIYKLSSESCRIYDNSGIIFTNVSMYHHNVFDNSYLTWRLQRPMKFGMLMEQRINYESIFGVSFISGGITTYHSNRISFRLRQAIVKIRSSREYFQIMGIPSNFTEKNIEFGNFSIPEFYQESYCEYNSFNTNFTYPPIIKVAYNTTVYPYKYLMLWLMNVTENGFHVCAKEMFSFSGFKQITVKYIAVGNETIEFTEVGKLHLTRMSHMRQENDHFCYTLSYKFSYTPKPYIFVTAEVGEKGCPGVRSWVKEIHGRHAVICASATSDTLQERNTNITLHYLITGRKDLCSNVTCPKGQECVLNSDLEPNCICASYCIDTYDPICGHDSITYNNTCQFFREVCLENGTEAKRSFLHLGKCKTFPYQAGSVLLEPIPNIPVAFCKYVHLNNKRFESDFPMHVQLTITWHNQTIKEGAAVWSENVTTFGFNTCVLVAGRHFLGIVPTPTVFWMAYQKGLIASSEGQLIGGSIDMPSWFSGSRCERLPVVYHLSFNSPTVFVSVEHTRRRTYKNAMTAWVEVSAWYRYWHVCVRELQNFDGMHEGIKLHWLLVRQGNTSWNHEIISEGIQSVIVTNITRAPVCLENQINRRYPSLPNPTIIASPSLIVYTYRSTVSGNDVVSWIERDNRRSAVGCVQSGYPYQRVNLNFMIVPTLCEDRWTFHDNKCFFVGRAANRVQAQQICQNMNSSLAVIRSLAQLYFMTTLEITSNTWIGLTDSEQDGSWKWNNGDVAMITDWGLNQPDGGVLENCAAMNVSDTYKWHDEPCSAINDYFCEKDANLLRRTCEGLCLNGGSCMLSTNGTKCLCPSGLFGNRCENDVKDVPECNNYTTLYDPWRRVNHNISKPFGHCDRNLTSNSTWYRFDESKIYEHNCPNTTSHYCGVKHPGYFNQSHPNVEDGVKQMRIHYYRFYCSGDYGTALVRNCAGFFVYKFPYLPFWDCDYGICTDYSSHSSFLM